MEPTPEISELNITSVSQPNNKPLLKKIFIGILVLVGITLMVLLQQATAPRTTVFPLTLSVEPGMSVATIAEAASEAKLVRSSFLLYVLLTLRHDPTSIYAGDYTFNEPQSVFGVAATLAAGEINDESIRLTIPEGMRVRDIASIITKTLPTISDTEYMELASAREGYLYPETYRIPLQFTAAEVIALQEKTYEERVAPLRPQITSSKFTEYEVLILASIIEREANDKASMKMVSGIFQNRLAIGMALQADASIEYILVTPLNELKEGELAENLRELDSPYNTYLYPGLPPTPIGNPGLTAIKAVLEPTPSDYFYYLTDSEGNFYYAKTLDEHNNNIARYLR